MRYFIMMMTALAAGCVPPSGAEGGGGSPLVALAPIVLIFVLFYFLILRPQQKQSKEREEMLKNLKRGDSVITSGGIYGRIINISGDAMSVEIAKGVTVRIARSGVVGIAKIEDEKEKSEK
ncbi:MAG: preprotein translocase subunit YajC [Deltaproteobacteria bacterium]